MEIKFGGLSREYSQFKPEIDQAVMRVLASGSFILNEEVQTFEEAFAKYLGVNHCVGVASGTDALRLALLSLEVGPGDEVITVAHSSIATAVAISSTGAKPVFIDIDAETFTLDVSQLEAAVTKRTKAIVPVHLYGQCTEMDPLVQIASERGIAVVEDCAQAHGATYKGRKAGTLGTLAAFSFYPTKNLGCYGDGGAVVTNDSQLAEKLTLIRNYGQRKRSHSEIQGINSRLDELQAAILKVKLPYLEAANERRREIANRYSAAFKSLPWVEIPKESSNNRHVYHLYVIQTGNRDWLQKSLSERGIQTLIHYPVPNHKQPCYAGEYGQVNLPVTERIASRILSLPLFPELSDREVDGVIENVREVFKDQEVTVL